MYRGSVVSIHVARCAGEPMIGVDHTRAVAGRGLEGDRYYEGAGFYSDDPRPIREVSLIEEKTIEALRRDHNLALAAGVTRRNITTRGVPLNHLIGREFRAGLRCGSSSSASRASTSSWTRRACAASCRPSYTGVACTLTSSAAARSTRVTRSRRLSPDPGTTRGARPGQRRGLLLQSHPIYPPEGQGVDSQGVDSQSQGLKRSAWHHHAIIERARHDGEEAQFHTSDTERQHHQAIPGEEAPLKVPAHEP